MTRRPEPIWRTEGQEPGYWDGCWTGAEQLQELVLRCCEFELHRAGDMSESGLASYRDMGTGFGQLPFIIVSITRLTLQGGSSCQ